MKLKIRLSFTTLSLLMAISFPFVIAHAQTGAPSQPKPVPIPASNTANVIDTISQGDDDIYRVGPGDVLDVRVFGRPELGREARIDSRGNIRLPFIGDLQVACLSENQLAINITEKYKKYLRDPQIDVFVKEFKSQPVAIIGSVGAPGRFQLQRRVRLLELLTFAGGSNLNAGGVVHIIRGAAPDFCEMNETNGAIAGSKAPAAIVPAVSAPSGIHSSSDKTSSNQAAADLPTQAALQSSIEQGQAVLLVFKLPDVLAGVPEANPYVRPGDIVSIPETDQIFVIGYVVKPGPVSIRNKITLLQAIGQAGGFMPDASRGKVKVLRQEPGSNVRKQMVYNIDEIQKKKAEDVVLLPNDVVDVPISIPKTSARSLLAVGIGMVGTLPYWIIR